MSDRLPWHHPGGKLRKAGLEVLAGDELLAILLSPGVKDRPAVKIARDIMSKFGSFYVRKDDLFGYGKPKRPDNFWEEW